MIFSVLCFICSAGLNSIHFFPILWLFSFDPSSFIEAWLTYSIASCTAQWFDLHMIWNDYHNKCSYHPSPHIDTKACIFFFLVMRTFSIYALSSFHIYHTAVLASSSCYIYMTSASYLSYTGSFCLFKKIFFYLFTWGWHEQKG